MGHLQEYRVESVGLIKSNEDDDQDFPLVVLSYDWTPCPHGDGLFQTEFESDWVISSRDRHREDAGLPILH